jgi:MFS family permease
MTGAPYKALSLGAGPFLLGLLPAARALPYALSTMWAGGRGRGGERLVSARPALGLAGLATLALSLVPALPWIYPLLALLGFVLAFFWPALQATLADRAPAEGVTGSLALFNVAWSTGKAIGFLAGGVLLALGGFSALFLVAGSAFLLVAVLVGGRDPSPVAPSIDLPSVPERDPRFRHAAWVANAVAFGIGAVAQTHLPPWLAKLDLGAAYFGAYLGLIFLSQTILFVLLGRSPGWHFRRLPLLGPQVLLVAAIGVLPLLRSPWLILATAPVVGQGLGVTYFSSIYYSVEAPRARGRNAGIHEALLGAGALSLPVLGGALAGLTGRLETPYFLAATAGLVSILVQGSLLGPRPAAVGKGLSEPPV